MKRRLLIVSPHFPPTNAPDMQRARQCLPHLAALGWEAEVLAVDSRDVAAPADPLLLESIPSGVPVHRVRALPRGLGRLLGVGSLAPRARPLLRHAGHRVLGRGGFDLVFFTTTQFGVMTLGPAWQRSWGVPFVVDWQDPWVTDYYDRPGAPRPPGGWKFRLAQRQARRWEEPCLRAAAGWVGTSAAYRDDLQRRYAWFAQTPAAVIPFGFAPEDLAIARSPGVTPAFARRDGHRHVVYVGAAGDVMRPALTCLFAGLRAWRDAHPEDRVRFHFVGTSYAPADRARKSVQPLAEAAGIGDLVEEQPARVGHFTALRTLLEADATLVLGSDDPGYLPSKLATVAFAGRPLLAVAPPGSGLDPALRTLGYPGAIRAGDPAAGAAIGRFLGQPPAPPPDVAARLEPFTAAARTRELAELFDRALSARPVTQDES